MNWIFRLIISLALIALATEIIVDSFSPLQTEICSDDLTDENQNPIDSDTDDDDKEVLKIKVKSIFNYHSDSNLQISLNLKTKTVSSVYHFPFYSSNLLAVPYSPPELV